MNRSNKWFLCFCLTLAANPASLYSQTRKPDPQLSSAISSLANDHRGEVAVAVENLETGEFFGLNADQPMPTASLIKFPLLIATYHAAEQGDVDLEKLIPLRERDKVPGSGVLTDHFSSGIELPLRDYIRLMMRFSDNTATNVVIDQIGLEATARRME